MWVLYLAPFLGERVLNAGRNRKDLKAGGIVFGYFVKAWETTF